MKIYTKKGDGGQTSLRDGVPIPKHHPVIQAMAALDELNAHLGLIKSRLGQTDAETAAELEQEQKNLIMVMAVISSPKAEKPDYFERETKNLESAIDKIKLPPQTSFVIYGGHPVSAALDLARAVARRAETLLSKAAESAENARAAFSYINRLSDFLYMKARFIELPTSNP